jgi:hypothetical protein
MTRQRSKALIGFVGIHDFEYALHFAAGPVRRVEHISPDGREWNAQPRFLGNDGRWITLNYQLAKPSAGVL